MIRRIISCGRIVVQRIQKIDVKCKRGEMCLPHCIDKVEIRAQQEAADDSLANLWRSELLCAKNKEMQKWRDVFPPFELF